MELSDFLAPILNYPPPYYVSLCYSLFNGLSTVFLIALTLTSVGALNVDLFTTEPILVVLAPLLKP